MRLAVCGNVVYGDVHQQLRYAKTKAQRNEWIKAIEMVEALKPKMVIPGHKKADELDRNMPMNILTISLQGFVTLISHNSYTQFLSS